MASGNAIVASNVGQLSEWIVNKRNGLLVPPGDVSALAEAIEQMIDDPALRLRLGQHGRDDAVQKHSWDHYLLSLEHLFFSLIINENDL
jgi:glycosyltransferase involved in cell wall biosynthesis